MAHTDADFGRVNTTPRMSRGIPLQLVHRPCWETLETSAWLWQISPGTFSRRLRAPPKRNRKAPRRMLLERAQSHLRQERTRRLLPQVTNRDLMSPKLTQPIRCNRQA